MLAIVILSRGKCGLSKCITRYLVGMAAADFLVVISEPILYRIIQNYLPVSFFFITPVCSLIYCLVFTSTVISVWLTVAFTFDRFIAICCEKVRTKYCTESVASLVIGMVCLLSCSVSIPWYFRHEPEYVIHNIPWYCITKPMFFSSNLWAVFVIFYVILTPCVPFFLIIFFNFLTVRQIVIASKVRHGLRSHNNGQHDRDLEMENRRKSIVLLFSISGSFVLLWVTQVVFYIYRRITQIYSYPVTEPLYITDSTANMLQLLCSCTNTCIYTMTQSKFRQEVKNLGKYPFNLLLKLVKSQ
ncbi:probable G-protein coupled receptor 139 [Rhincodon typus]|uniref:probable G-protein coupled receptor 139 n=1 Tax=Rhincodon typus TaxID=259920 RepID=UPI0020307841|nr:probable G-protein coupled receptor 139 [Rhincodon typus]